MNTTVIVPKKLIEVAMPLDRINEAAAKEKSIRHGHPSTLHLWWARRPLAAARAVIFGQLVNDPSWRWELEQHELEPPASLRASWAASRQRLFSIIEELVQWENTNNRTLIAKARAEILKSWREVCVVNANHPLAATLFNPNELPDFHDPFAGGGTLPIEAQRLGLKAHASDLNPVAVLINKAMIEIPDRFQGIRPVNSAHTIKMDLLTTSWPELKGLAEDIRFYGQWMRDQAERRIGNLYPRAVVNADIVKKYPHLKSKLGASLPVIAWLWARTVKCPNPACSRQMPLLSSCILSARTGQFCYLWPVIEQGVISFDVRDTPPPNVADPKKGFKRGMSGVFECAFCGTVTSRNYVADQATSLGLGSVQTAVVVETKEGRTYLPAITSLLPVEIPQADLSGLEPELAPNPRDVWCRNFGLLRPKDLFTARQLVALTTFSDLIREAANLVKVDAVAAGIRDCSTPLRDGGNGATAYAEAVSVYLAFCVDKMTDTNTCLCSWQVDPPRLRATFGRQAIPMVWDYAEANIFGDAAGDFGRCVGSLSEVLEKGGFSGEGWAEQLDAQSLAFDRPRIVSTDPPYYDNIGYADLSDFFMSGSEDH